MQTGTNKPISDLVKKVVIDESTGLTSLGTYSLGYLPNMTELVIPESITQLGTSCLSTASSLKTITVSGRTDAGEGIYDFRTIKSISSHALAGAASAAKVTDPITVWFGDDMTSFPSNSGSGSWNWFSAYGADNTTTTPNAAMTTKVIFCVQPGTTADSVLSAYVARQQTYDASAETPDISKIDKTCTTNVALQYFGIGGNCKDDYSGYLWSFDEESGVLTISGTSSSKTLAFTKAVDWSPEDQKNSPWYDYRSQIKKVVIEEETGITSIQKYVFAYLKNCTTVIMPTSVADLSAYNIFSGCDSLTSIAYSEEDVKENVYDLRYAKSLNTQLFEDTAPGKTISVLCSSGTLPKGIAKWFKGSTTVNFSVYPNSPIDEWLKAVKAGTDTREDAYKFTIGDITYMSVGDNPLLSLSGTDTVNGNYSWTLDYDSGTLTFTRLKTDWCEFYFSSATTDFTAWLNDWRKDIKHIVVPEFSKYQDASGIYPFANLPNLETVKWDTTRMMSTGGNENIGVFYNCEKLSTFGTSKNFKLGTVNLSGFSLESISTEEYSKNMFYNCRGIEKVIFGDAVYMTGDKADTIVPFCIGPSMFENCTSLKEVEFSAVDGLMANAFKGCTALKGDIYYTGDASVASAFDNCGGVIIRTDTAKRARAIALSLNAAGVSIEEAMVAAIVHSGFSVRTSGYNGIRSFFSFIGENVGSASYTIVEYGTICGEAENYSSYTQDFGTASSILRLDGTEFKTANDRIIKTPVYVADGYTGNEGKKTTNEDGTVSFTVTIVNFDKANYASDIIMTGYEIWKDTEGNYTVIYTEAQNDDYKQTSLRDVTLGMLVADVIDFGGADSPVNTVVDACEKIAISTGNDAVEAYLIDHHIEKGKKIAVYRTTSSEEIDLGGFGIPTEYLPIVKDYIFEGNIIFTDVPEIDDYWKEHIDAQLATIPKGKSFIAITDTHYPSNAGKSADLMQYVRAMTGIKKVINLGDPYHDGASYEIAKNNLIHSMDTKFFKYFGEDGMYAIGNHDSNLTKARSTGDSDSATYKMDLLLSDKDIYENSFKYIEEAGKKNGNVVYDEELLAIIEANKSDIKEFVLDNVAAENASTYNNMFGDVSYTAEEMYQNLVYWAKMHYAYYDHESKICYIVLNTGGLTVTDFAILNRELWKFHPSQYNFLETMLNEISDKYSDYDVVVAGHMFYDKSVANETYNKSLFQMLSAFEGASTISFSASGNNAFSGKLFGCTDGATSRTLSYDFTNRNFTGEIICLTGHRHLDLDLVSQTKGGKFQASVAYESVKDDLSNNAILLLLLNQDNYNESKGDNEADSQTMVKGTITEHCFTIFTITEDNTLVATRIGANSGTLQKEYKLGGYDKGWEFTKTDKYTATKALESWPKTIEAVISLPTSYSSRAGVVLGNYGETKNINFEISAGGKPRLYISGADNVFDVDIRSNGLTHVAITVEDINETALTATIKCYVNGVLAQTKENAPIKAEFAVANLMIGGDHRTDNEQYFKGSIKKAAAYSYARSAEQIAEDYANFGGGDPLFCYELDGKKTLTITDKSGNMLNMVHVVK